MTTPVDDRPEPTYNYDTNHPTAGDLHASNSTESRETGRERSGTLPSYNVNRAEERRPSHTRSSDEEGTMIGDQDHSHQTLKPQQHQRQRSNSHLTVETVYEHGDPLQQMYSPGQTREQAHRMADDLMLHKIERQVSAEVDAAAASTKANDIDEDEPLYRSRSRKREDHVDEFDIATNPVHEKTAVYKPPEHPTSSFSKFVKRVHQSNWVVRYFTYITPVTLILLAPCLVGFLAHPNATVGGVYLGWFMVWLEIVWLTLWLGRIIAKCLPWPIGLVSSLFTNNSKKWRDMGKQLELPATLFFWWLAIEVSFLPLMTNRQRPPQKGTQEWMSTLNKILVSALVCAVLNFVEKVIIQLIAISFHLRTYADRIEINKFQIGSLTKLYKYSKDRITMEDSEFEEPGTGTASGARTPGAFVDGAAKQTKEVFTKFGDVAGKIAGDFTGRQVTKSTHPSQVTIALLSSTTGSQVLARRLYRTFAREGTETVFSEDLHDAFENEEEATAAFSMFDKDMNGDISMEELEAVCVEIGRERKSITASLKDLDSVVAKLDDIFMFIVAVIVTLVLISLLSSSAGAAITSAGSVVLALSWLFSATAQEFLQSVIFVFVKHPFDVGDRVGIYGNTGALGRGDDYFVKEISLLYTEFKKMEGHVVQAPNSVLNGLFILNQRRSGGLAEAVPIVIKFGTTLEQIDGLRARLLEFVKSEKREYQGNILTELREIKEVYSLTLNVVFFYKSNWQNEGLRLARRNKFICAMMVCMQELGIEGPSMREAGLKQSFPMYYQSVPYFPAPGMGSSGHPDNPNGWPAEQQSGPSPSGGQDPPFVPPIVGNEHHTSSAPFTPASQTRSGSILRNASRPRRESLAAMSKRVDFSLGMSGHTSSNYAADVYTDRDRERISASMAEASASRERRDAEARRPSASERYSAETGRSTSAQQHQSLLGPGNLLRRSTTDDSMHGKSSVHRNRFTRWRPSATGDEAQLMESGMADISEEAPPTADPIVRDMDPRTGVINSAAWHNDGAVQASGARRGVSFEHQDDGIRPLGRSQTDAIEMRRL